MNRPSVDQINTLAKFRIVVSCPVMDPAWDGLRSFSVRAYFPNQGNAIRNMTDYDVCYFPRHKDAWENHPQAMRAMEFLYYGAQGRGIDVRRKRINALFFLVPPSWVGRFLAGQRSEMDFLAELEQTNPPRYPERMSADT